MTTKFKSVANLNNNLNRNKRGRQTTCFQPDMTISNDQSDPTQVFHPEWEIVPRRSDEHEIDGDVPFFG